MTKPVILTLDQIDTTDHRFDLLHSDSRKYHITDMILVQEAESGCRIVRGFEIVNAGLPDQYQFPAICFSENESLINILKTLVEIQGKTRPLFPIETARMFRIAREYGVPDSELMEFLFPALGLKSEMALIDRYLQFVSFNESIVDYLIDKRAPVKTWFYLVQYNSDDQSELLQLIHRRPTLRAFEEIVINLHEIQKRENISLSEILKQLRWMFILSDENPEPQKCIEVIRKEISRRRFPLLSARQEKIAEALRQIPIPENSGIQYDETFEKKELRINWRLSTNTELQRMQNFCTNDIIQKIRQVLDAF